MAKRSIYFPEDLETRMSKFPDANWSAVCQEAVEAHIRKLNLRTKTMTSAMERASERLKVSKFEYVEKAHERGRSAGAYWAADRAEYGELKRLADSADQLTDLDTIDALGAPGIVIRVIESEAEFAGRQSIADFWVNLGFDKNDDDLYSAAWWEGFVEGAVELFDNVDI